MRSDLLCLSMAVIGPQQAGVVRRISGDKPSCWRWFGLSDLTASADAGSGGGAAGFSLRGKQRCGRSLSPLPGVAITMTASWFIEGVRLRGVAIRAERDAGRALGYAAVSVRPNLSGRSAPPARRSCHV